jgi:UDP-2,4-diacetamido-2,4,6-trideoxy-beta-L-altropyranose hydrolase
MTGTCVFRVDALPFIGVGHLMRCLALADALRAYGMDVHFICRDGENSSSWLVERQGFTLHRLPPSATPSNRDDPWQWLGVSLEADIVAATEVILSTLRCADWLVVDHYAIDFAWEQRLRSVCRRILVIDDLANRQHDCDLLLDQSLRDANPYVYLTPDHAEVLLGPRYALLRSEFSKQRIQCRPREGVVNRLVVFFGGSDTTGDTLRTLEALVKLPDPIQSEIIVGGMNASRQVIEAICRPHRNLKFAYQVSDMALRFASADLAIGAAGTTSWERLSVGLPTLVIEQVDNQTENAKQLEKHGVAIRLGRSSTVRSCHILSALQALMVAPERVHQMSTKAMEMVDAQGANRIARAMRRML